MTMYTARMAQLVSPKVTRQLRFSEDGWNALLEHKDAFEKKIGRRISESVCLDIMLRRDITKYVTNK
jgi:hypothetical protein